MCLNRACMCVCGSGVKSTRDRLENSMLCLVWGRKAGFVQKEREGVWGRSEGML